MVSTVPTVPDVGDRAVMAGGFTAKVFPFDTLTEVSTITGPVVAPDGTVHSIAVFDHEVTVADTLLNNTLDEPWLGPK